MHLPFKEKKNKNLEVTDSQWARVLKQRFWIPGPHRCSASHWLPRGHLKEIWDNFHPQPISGESEKELVKKPRDLQTPDCSVGEGQRCGPPASVIKQQVLCLQGEEHGHCSLKVMLARDYFFLSFSIFWSGG